jgi:threonine/homoserine/homoserine lactone efflux protein
VARALGAIVLLAIGVALLARPRTQERVRVQGHHTSFVLGLASAGLNPTIVATWLVVVTTLYGMGLLDMSYAGAAAFAAGVTAGVLAWFAVVLGLGQALARLMTPERRALIMRSIGLLMIGSSIILAVRLVS